MSFDLEILLTFYLCIYNKRICYYIFKKYTDCCILCNSKKKFENIKLITSTQWNIMQQFKKNERQVDFYM